MLGGKAVARQIEGNIREVVFGLEDSLVSTLGAITGIAAGTGNVHVVILSGVVLVFVEAVSMSAGSYLSSKSAAEVMDRRRKQDASRVLQEDASSDRTLHKLFERKGLSKKEVGVVLDAFQKERMRWVQEVERGEYPFMPTGKGAVKAAIFMGLFYLLGGVFPLLPYALLPVGNAVLPSIVLTGILLFGLGVAKARIAGTDWVKSGFEMAAISLTAALLGYLIGRVVSSLLGMNVI